MILCFSPRELWANLCDLEVETNNLMCILPLNISSYLQKDSFDIQNIYV